MFYGFGILLAINLLNLLVSSLFGYVPLSDSIDIFDGRREINSGLLIQLVSVGVIIFAHFFFFKHEKLKESAFLISIFSLIGFAFKGSIFFLLLDKESLSYLEGYDFYIPSLALGLYGIISFSQKIIIDKIKIAFYLVFYFISYTFIYFLFYMDYLMLLSHKTAEKVNPFTNEITMQSNDQGILLLTTLTMSLISFYFLNFRAIKNEK